MRAYWFDSSLVVELLVLFVEVFGIYDAVVLLFESCLFVVQVRGCIRHDFVVDWGIDLHFLGLELLDCEPVQRHTGDGGVDVSVLVGNKRYELSDVLFDLGQVT